VELSLIYDDNIYLDEDETVSEAYTVLVPGIILLYGDDRLHGITCRIPGSTLLPNFYSLQLGAHSVETGRGLDWVPDLVTFRVSSAHVPDQEPLEIHDKGLVRLTVSWEHEA